MNGCIEKPANYHLDSLYLYFSGNEQDGIKAVTYLSKGAGNRSGEENVDFKSLVEKDLTELQQGFPDISSISIVEWNINYDGAKLKIVFGKDISDNTKAGLLEKLKNEISKQWYVSEVKYDYK